MPTLSLVLDENRDPNLLESPRLAKTPRQKVSFPQKIRVLMPQEIGDNPILHTINENTTYGTLKRQSLQRSKNSRNLLIKESNFVFYCEHRGEMRDDQICNPETHLKIDSVNTINLRQTKANTIHVLSEKSTESRTPQKCLGTESKTPTNEPLQTIMNERHFSQSPYKQACMKTAANSVIPVSNVQAWDCVTCGYTLLTDSSCELCQSKRLFPQAHIEPFQVGDRVTVCDKVGVISGEIQGGCYLVDLDDRNAQGAQNRFPVQLIQRIQTSTIREPQIQSKKLGSWKCGACGYLRSLSKICKICDARKITNDQRKKRENAFFVAATFFGCTSYLFQLLKTGVSVNMTIKETGETALHIASHRGNLEAVELLVHSKADVNAKDNKLNTALMLAMEKPHFLSDSLANHAGVIKFLCHSGAIVHETKKNQMAMTTVTTTTMTVNTTTTTTMTVNTTTTTTMTVNTTTTTTMTVNTTTTTTSVIMTPMIKFRQGLTLTIPTILKKSLDLSPSNYYILVREWLFILPDEVANIIMSYCPGLFIGNPLKDFNCWPILLSQPIDMVVDGEMIFMISIKSNSVTVIHPNGTFGIPGSEGGHSLPISLTLIKNVLYVLDFRAGRFQMFMIKGTTYVYIKTVGSIGTATGQFQSPRAICSTSKRIFVADNGNHRIQMFNRKGSFVNSWSISGSMHGMAVDDNHVCLSDLNGQRVTVYTHTGDELLTIPIGQNKNLTSFSPSGLGVMNNFIYVYDGSGKEGRVLVFDMSGRFIWTWGGLADVDVSGIHATPDCIFVLGHSSIPSFN